MPTRSSLGRHPPLRFPPCSSLYCQKTQRNWKIDTSSCRLPIIVVEHPSELLLTSDAAHLWEKLQRFDEFVVDPLMIAPMAIVIDIQRNGCPEVFFTQEDQPAQTLLLDRANKPLRMSVALRNPRRTENDIHAGSLENLPEALAVLGIAVKDQVRFAQSETV